VQELGLDNQPISAEAAAHREKFRFRCRAQPCGTEFCASCAAMPYHAGFTCQGYIAYKASRQCRFCGTAVPPTSRMFLQPGEESNKKKCVAVLRARMVEFRKNDNAERLSKVCEATQLVGEVCEESECQRRLLAGCSRLLACAHVCKGVRDEGTCLGCLRCPAPLPKWVKGKAGLEEPQAEEFCGICYVEVLAQAPCVRLTCGHLFHEHCVRAKVQGRWSGVRINFGFLNCSLCKVQMSGPMIEKIVAPAAELFKVVAVKAEQRLALESSLKNAPELQPGGTYHGKLLDFAMKKFAYYMCFKCSQPYFGGLRSCEQEDQELRDVQSDEMVCGGCSVSGDQSCPTHGLEAIEYKCKFCCSVASWFCWGTTHFCDSCHRKQGTPDSMSRKLKKDLPQCAGQQACPLRVKHPDNGEEFVLGCQICRSASSV